MIIDKKEIVRITGVYMAINIGAGFTSGQELLQFFSGFGLYGYLTGVVVFLLMFYGGEAIIDAGYICKDDNKISVYEYFGGNVLGKFYNIIIPILLYGSYIVMIAGAGSVLEQFLHIPNIIGRFIVVVASVISLFFNFQNIVRVISKIGKGIAIIIFIISLIVILKADFVNLLRVDELLDTLPVIKVSNSFYGAGILYSCTIILASSQLLFDLGAHLQNRINGFYGILWGTVGFICIALVIHTGIILYFDKVYNLPIITLYFAELISPFLATVMTFLLFIAMYSASTVCLWSVSNIIRKKFSLWKFRYMTIIVSLGTGGLFLSSIPFAKLVNILYPINGFFGLCLLVLIIIKNRKYLKYE